MTRLNPRSIGLLALACTAALSFTGCGGGGLGGASDAPDRADAVTEQVDADASRASKPKPPPYGSRRGIQAIYFLALDGTFVDEICNKLDTAPRGKRVEIEFSAAHDSGKRWANAVTAINRLSGRGLNLVVDFGHHKVAGDMSAYDWGKNFCNALFKDNYNRVNFILQAANEDDYTDPEWSAQMTQILSGMRDSWPNKRTFPYARITLRRTPIKPGATVKTSFKFDKKSIKVESEYHFPAGQNVNWGNSATAISNDGHMIHLAGVNTDTAYEPNSTTPLRAQTMADFKAKFGKRALLLWHPALHRWSFANGGYSSSNREDVSGDNKTRFLNLLGEFMKN